jgi:hypothetical protein
MIMKKTALLFIILTSCQTVWEEDLREKALDSIRGEYELTSGVWEGSDPIDIDGDGKASYDYLSQLNNIKSGDIYINAKIGDKTGRIDIPHANYTTATSLKRYVTTITVQVNAAIEGNESHLEFFMPEGYKFRQTGYGEFEISRHTSVNVFTDADKPETVYGDIRFHYKRTKYRTDL